MSELVTESASAAPFGVYIHIPFCVSKCEYCAFATWTDRHHLTDPYLAALQIEIERAVGLGMPVASSIFVGGGTPSMVEPAALMAVVAGVPVTKDAEITIECNPDNVTPDLMRAYVDGGVNRVSIGVQSMMTHVLGALGRQHSRANVQRAVDAVRAEGMPTFNLDIIYGAAGESLDDWERTVAQVLLLEPPHVSAYGLTVEAGTPLDAQPDRHPDDDDQADKYDVVDEAMACAGLENYEISNWARPGHECRHNVLYWRQQNYRGFGCAAHSHHDGHRWWNVRTPDRYIDLVTADEPTEAAGETLDQATKDFERLELQLRMRDGVPLGALDIDGLDGLVEQRGDRLVLTRSGRLLANEISLRLK